ncbi:MAG: Flp family type IVb pilin [Alphaproteobacteria bacterium]
MRYLTWITVLVRTLKSKSGVTAIEYGLIAALIAVAIITAVTLVGSNLTLTFNAIAGHLGNSPH